MSASIRLTLESGLNEDSDTLTDELLGIISNSENVQSASRTTNGLGKQDAGVIIGVILASAAVTELARGIADWIRAKNGAKVTVTYPDGPTVSAETIDANTALNVIEMALKKGQEKQP
ncbi:MAG: hypothetical protein H7Y22_00385 [Gemmatimonadaceae bacterium]|nr:hypothetical protein [Gloeobacterales cyanobacterium ES-bin-141]